MLNLKTVGICFRRHDFWLEIQVLCVQLTCVGVAGGKQPRHPVANATAAHCFSRRSKELMHAHIIMCALNLWAS